MANHCAVSALTRHSLLHTTAMSQQVCCRRTPCLTLSCACARENGQDIGNILGALYLAVLFLGIINSRTVQPPCAYERTVMYRERAAGMCVPAVLILTSRLLTLLPCVLRSPAVGHNGPSHCYSGAAHRRYNELPFALAQCVIVSSSLLHATPPRVSAYMCPITPQLPCTALTPFCCFAAGTAVQPAAGSAVLLHRVLGESQQGLALWRRSTFAIPWHQCTPAVVVSDLDFCRVALTVECKFADDGLRE